MRPVIVKAYGALSPVTEAAYHAAVSVLESWYIPEAAELRGDMLCFSYEGDMFPDAELVEALKPYLCNASEGKLDILDLEAWTLHRYFFAQGRLHDHTVTLDKALESCSMH